MNDSWLSNIQSMLQCERIKPILSYGSVDSSAPNNFRIKTLTIVLQSSVFQYNTSGILTEGLVCAGAVMENLLGFQLYKGHNKAVDFEFISG